MARTAAITMTVTTAIIGTVREKKDIGNSRGMSRMPSSVRICLAPSERGN
jgi:hypothetical protein